MEFYFIHKEWNDMCILDYNTHIIKRKYIENEWGSFIDKEHTFTIRWNNWSSEDVFEKKENIFIDTYILKKNVFNNKKIKLEYKNSNEECYIIGDFVSSYQKKINGKTNYVNDILVIEWDTKDKELFYHHEHVYYELQYYLTMKQTENTPCETKCIKNKPICTKEEDDDIYSNKHVFKKINNTYYNLEYIDTFINKKNKINVLKQGIYKNIQNNELYFNNLKKINSNYLDISNYNKYKYHYLINTEKINQKYFEIESNFDIKRDTMKQSILTICEWGYPPFGGGENWLLNLNKIFYELGYDTFFICFSDGFSGKTFNDINYIDLGYVKIIQMPFNYYEVGKFIRFIQPSIINHQGIKRIELMKLANIFEIPFLTGYCFWNNIIEQVYSNINILDNDHIQPDKQFKTILKYSHCYSASDFVNDVIHKLFKEKLDVIQTISLKDDYFIEEKELCDKYYVSMINCHHNKGGFLLKYLIKNLNINIPLLLVYTEYDDIIPLSELKGYIQQRNELNNINILYTEKQDVKNIYSKTRIMLTPSLCDETFCRVAYESKMNNIPILSTTSGNLKYLLKDYAVFLDETPELWLTNIEKIYYDKKYTPVKNIQNSKILKYKYNEEQKKVKNIEENETEIKERIQNKIKKIITPMSNKIDVNNYTLNENNIGIIAPWADQGLGIQARSYYNSLKQIGFEPYIFSFRPYHGNESNNFLQIDPSEWNMKNITYSTHIREDIEINEIIEFIWKNKIKKLIIIEATFEHIFKLASFLKLLNVKLYIVINIECIKITEISYHCLFDKIFCNNFNSYHIMNNLIPNKCYHLGFHLDHSFFKNNIKIKKKIEDKKSILKFVSIGGLNSISRKNIDKLANAFQSIFNKNKKNILNIELNIFIQGIEIPDILNHTDCTNIKIHINNYSYKENLQNILKNDIYIHLGGQEGLGLGFYEALYLGLPILTLNWTPNNEIVTHEKNGWLIECNIDKIYENQECLIQRGLIDQEILEKQIIEISKNRKKTYNIINYTIQNSIKMKLKYKKDFYTTFKYHLSSVPSFN